jgi:XTP/dITP diphosphohydrolase
MTAGTPRWVVASANEGKLAEIRALLADLPLTIVAQAQLGVASAEETAPTFVENALIKARHAASLTGIGAIADDSGLSVDALGGAPGVHSARYAGTNCTAADNIALLLRSLDGVPDTRRSARFHCVIVALRSADDPVPIIAQGQWTGHIAAAPAGAGGFGYDPVFYDPELKATAAQLPPDVKNRVSHRGRALVALREALRSAGA